MLHAELILRWIADDEGMGIAARPLAGLVDPLQSSPTSPPTNGARRPGGR